METYLKFNRSEKRISIVMTPARIQPYFKQLSILVNKYSGEEKWPRVLREKNTAILLYSKQVSPIWNAERFSFKKDTEQLKANFETVDNYKTDENVDCCFDYEYKLKKIESQVTNFSVYDLETYKKKE